MALMRFHRTDWDKPWPLGERLWEARRGLWVGAIMSGMTFGLLFAVCVGLRVAFGWNNVFIRLFGSWVFLGLITVGSIWQSWMKDLDTVNLDSITWQEKAEWRLKHLERDVARLSDLSK